MSSLHPLRRHHVLLLEEETGSRALLFPSLESCGLLAAALAAAAGIAVPQGLGPRGATSGNGVRLSRWIIGLDARPTLAVTGETPEGPLLLLAPNPVAALTARMLVGGRNWRPSVFPLEDGLTADLGVHPVTGHPSIGAREVPPARLSAVLCPRCEDRPLHVDAVFDDRSRVDGSRICNACGTLEALRLETYARMTDRGAH
jgi:hypothetical protein